MNHLSASPAGQPSTVSARLSTGPSALPLKRRLLLLAIPLGLAHSLTAFSDQVINDDLIVDGSACIGLDCSNGETFGFSTILTKENNLRVRFVDTSTTASFPTNDWEITLNDSSNGGNSYFGITDVNTNRSIAKFEAGAPSNSMVVESSGDVGFGTANPIVELHTTAGDTPTLRLEQDGSSGWSPQTWDMAGNETNFFIRDVSNGSALPFRIEPGAPTNAINIDDTGDIGFGTVSPEGSLHVTEADNATLVLESTNAGVQWEIKTNVATGRLTFKDLNGTTTPFKFEPTAVGNLLVVGVDAVDQVTIGGNLVIDGQCEESDGACADYVFEDDYQLRSIDELQSFITENRHLPNVPSAEEMDANGINIATISGRLLEKIEELTLYTIAQEQAIETISAQYQETVEQLNRRIDLLEP